MARTESTGAMLKDANDDHFSEKNGCCGRVVDQGVSLGLRVERGGAGKRVLLDHHNLHFTPNHHHHHSREVLYQVKRPYRTSLPSNSMRECVRR
jgi:hypothetical protein